MKIKIVKVELYSVLFGLIFTSCTFISEMVPAQVIVTHAQALEAFYLAEGKLGKPSLWAGNGPDSFDCSGLIV